MDASGGIGGAATPLRRDSADRIASRSDQTAAIRCRAARDLCDPGLGGGPGHAPPSETT
ncbi:hypothetical protein [Elioraea tepidiphila]|jgi:hypothetical protein|uniref:hypothetical protein n=1 Tax=Elioraea tepidiphila TaxID=457934 RepID=UPI0003816F14|nr:hypothetical protein [Elioraea tepidiphila]